MSQLINEQLSLWQESAHPPLLPSIGQTIEHINAGWADGDTSPSALQHLAEVLLRPGCRIVVWPTGAGHSTWFRTIQTRVEGEHVIQTLERIAPLIGGCQDIHDEGEEEI